MELQGRTRKFYVHSSQKKEEERQRPLLLVLHGRLGSGKQIMGQSEFNTIADRESFVVVYPDGYRRSWADGRGVTPADRENVNDIAFLENIISFMNSKYKTDPTKVFILGHSNGGFMTQRILLEKTNLFRAGVSVSSQISVFLSKNYSPSSPVSVALILGTLDSAVPFLGGFVKDGGEILSGEESVSRWVTWNGCENIPELKTIDTKDDHTRVEIVSYNRCKGKVKVRLYKIVGGGHTLPGKQRSRLLLFFGVDGGPKTEEIDAAEAAWDFFKSTL